MVIISAAISLGQSLPNLGGVATAGGSAVTIFQIIDTVNMHSITKIYSRHDNNNNNNNSTALISSMTNQNR